MGKVLRVPISVGSWFFWLAPAGNPGTPGSASLPRLSEQQFARLEQELARGPAAHGWEYQRWTLERVKTVIGRRFHLTYTIQGVRKPGGGPWSLARLRG
ncbi:winged helix-turn-helix domain-containing protein [Streptomyces piniterrae]|uniref:Winged helix-turn-helix domain-containing protein n=1 Tax=Streptomyces piniterrae TaxID=2571125 RepID=A0A4U0NRH0_9ACTN|nr:winged helix-turn-helix domain-containing protein [Streptomyces piniterrae]TJZ57166.1 winged helix-turn-helix domain-containing protein [Streptomyces piniterrae]